MKYVEKAWIIMLIGYRLQLIRLPNRELGYRKWMDGIQAQLLFGFICLSSSTDVLLNLVSHDLFHRSRVQMLRFRAALVPINFMIFLKAMPLFCPNCFISRCVLWCPYFDLVWQWVLLFIINLQSWFFKNLLWYSRRQSDVWTVCATFKNCICPVYTNEAAKSLCEILSQCRLGSFQDREHL